MAAEKTVEEKQNKRRRRRQAEEEEEVLGKGRVTPGRRNKSEEKTEGNFITRPFLALVNYFQDVSAELDKVSWPTREEALRLARIVLIVTVASSIVLGGLSILAAALLDFGLMNEIVFVVAFVGIVAGAFVAMRRGLL
ncbi:preprotein translocase subunit SecE [Phototrophicus methaneseepsis]|uniref:Protein translocase subunit SecE n=1 Tax=Phototrophicus methaneseepsis TaxID=2710758 RepID=A0A7S8E9G6_9CHLR|nr:preprotein translocase subunit SecE [Phototrophicus methaneseepsis]QPC82863.1 preprotein translocase subunit SecE [Phototrophicus methaneseepsis]